MKIRILSVLGLSAVLTAGGAHGADAVITLESVDAAPGSTALVGVTIDASDLIGSLDFDASAGGRMISDVEYDGPLFASGWDGWDTAASSVPNIAAACIFPRDQVTGFQALFTLEIEIPSDATAGSTIPVTLTDAFVTDYRFTDYDITLVAGEILIVEGDCRADIAMDDGTVGILDLLTLLDAWGTDDAAADLDASGVVDISDVLLMLDDWGGC